MGLQVPLVSEEVIDECRNIQVFQVVLDEYLVEQLEFVVCEGFLPVLEEGFNEPQVEVRVVGHVCLVELEVVDRVGSEVRQGLPFDQEFIVVVVLLDHVSVELVGFGERMIHFFPGLGEGDRGVVLSVVYGSKELTEVDHLLVQKLGFGVLLVFCFLFRLGFTGSFFCQIPLFMETLELAQPPSFPRRLPSLYLMQSLLPLLPQLRILYHPHLDLRQPIPSPNPLLPQILLQLHLPLHLHPLQTRSLLIPNPINYALVPPVLGEF